VRLGEEGVHAGGDDRTDVRDLEELRLARMAQPLEAAEVPRQVLRRRLADMADAEAVEEPSQRRGAAAGDPGDEVGRALLAHPLEALQLLLRQGVDVGERAHQAAVHQLVDHLLAQALDVEGAAAGEVEQRELALRRADQAAGAAVIGPARLAHDVAATGRASERHAEVGHVAVARLGHAADDLRNHVPGAADDDAIACADALPPHLEDVVQRRARHRRAADEHRLEPGHRRQLAGAAHLHLDAEQARRLLLRRVFLRRRPARLARLEAEPLLQRPRVDLVDDAVDLERQRRPLGGDVGVEGDQAGGALDARVQRARRQAQRREPLEKRRLRLRQRPADELAETVGEEVERPLRGVACVELPHHAGGGVARVDEDLLALGAAFDQPALPFVQRREVVEPHEDLAPHLDRAVVDAGEPLRHGADREHGVRHVFPGLAVAPGRRLDQPTLLVAEVDGEAVELELGRVDDRRVAVGQAERAPHALVEALGAGRRRIGLGVDREHRHGVPHRSEPVEHRPDHALRGRIGDDEVGMRGLDRLELLEEEVVVGVGQRRRVQHVVGVRVTAQHLAQLHGPGRRLAGRQGLSRRRVHAAPRRPVARCTRSRSGRTRAARNRRSPRFGGSAQRRDRRRGERKRRGRTVGTSRIKRLTMPRAGRPVKSLVSAVCRLPSLASAARCTAPVSASGQRMNAVPTCTAEAPSASAAATVERSAMPPAAITGMRTARTTCGRSANVPICSDRSWSRK
jgi:hypothetical protein